MKPRFVDANIFIRFLTKDDLLKAEKCFRLFQEAERRKVLLITSKSILAEVVHILSSKALYALSPKKIRELLEPVITLKGWKIKWKKEFLLALEIYAEKNIDFEDALAAAAMRTQEIETIYSYDRHFDRLNWVKRIEP